MITAVVSCEGYVFMLSKQQVFRKVAKLKRLSSLQPPKSVS